MRRKFLNIFTALSLALAAPAIVLWVRSATVRESIGWNSATTDPPTLDTGWLLVSGGGQIALLRDRMLHPALTPQERAKWVRWHSLAPHPIGWEYKRQATAAAPPNDLLGFGIEDSSGGGFVAPWAAGKTVREEYQWVSVPYWFITVMLLAPSAFSAFAAARRKRRRRGFPVEEPPHNRPMQRAATASSGAVE
jgi:hypothetical protein